MSAEGLHVMTFNENGRTLQSLKLDEHLAQQYPLGTMTLFESFTGVPYIL